MVTYGYRGTEKKAITYQRAKRKNFLEKTRNYLRVFFKWGGPTGGETIRQVRRRSREVVEN